jgi:RNA polymerase sigma-70 factor (ECF subfamily)
MELLMRRISMDGTGFGQDLDDMTLARARRGENSALEAIYRRFARSAFALALRIIGNPASAEDVAQDAFLRAFERIGSYRGDAGFGAWIKRLVVNAAIDRLRKDRRLVEGEAEIEALSSAADTAENAVEALGLLSRLSPQLRTVLWLHQMEGWSHAEIAAQFGNSESWSKSILARGLQRMRAWLQAEPEATP